MCSCLYISLSLSLFPSLSVLYRLVSADCAVARHALERNVEIVVVFDGMASYTDAVMNYAQLYANERLKLAQINLMYTRLPNLATSLTYSIGQADKTDDYYYPSSFVNKAIKVNVALNENGCRKFSCSNLKFDGSYCTTNEEPSYYRVGDNENFD